MEELPCMETGHLFNSIIDFYREEGSVEVESIPWTYQDSTSNSTRKLRHENCKIIQEFHGDNTDKTLTMAALSFTDLKRILLNIKT